MVQACMAGCCPHEDDETPRSTGGMAASAACPADVPGALPPERIAHLYACQGLSTYRIGELTGISRQRVTRVLHRLGVQVKPKGAGRQRRTREPGPFPDPLLADLYLRQRLTCAQISALTGIPARSVWDRLRAHGVRMRTRGALNREDRLAIAPELLTDMYIHAGLPSGEIGKILGVSRRIVLRSAHDEGLPVRMGGPGPRRGPSEIELISALYSDPEVREVLRRCNVRPVAPGGPIWERFPDPTPLSPDLVRDLFGTCGLATTHIELLTGQPADSVRKALRKAAAPLRPGGGRSPFFRRWRASQAEPRIPGGAPLRRTANSPRGTRPVSVIAAKKPDTSRPGPDGSQIPSREDEQAGSGEPSCWLRTGEQ